MRKFQIDDIVRITDPSANKYLEVNGWSTPDKGTMFSVLQVHGITSTETTAGHMIYLGDLLYRIEFPSSHGNYTWVHGKCLESRLTRNLPEWW